jgi:hypothetical protein
VQAYDMKQPTIPFLSGGIIRLRSKAAIVHRIILFKRQPSSVKLLMPDCKEPMLRPIPPSSKTVLTEKEYCDKKA